MTPKSYRAVEHVLQVLADMQIFVLDNPDCLDFRVALPSPQAVHRRDVQLSPIHQRDEATPLLYYLLPIGPWPSHQGPIPGFKEIRLSRFLKSEHSRWLGQRKSCNRYTPVRWPPIGVAPFRVVKGRECVRRARGALEESMTGARRCARVFQVRYQ